MGRGRLQPGVILQDQNGAAMLADGLGQLLGTLSQDQGSAGFG